MEELERMLADLRQDGACDSEGRFTVAPGEALPRLAKSLLAEPERYLLKFVQCLVAAGASLIELQIGMRQVEVRGREAVLDVLPRDWVPLAYASEPSALRHLATGVIGAWESSASVVIEAGSLRLVFHPEQGADFEVAPRFEDGWVRLRSVRRKWSWAPPESRQNRRLVACPVEVRCAGQLLQARSYRLNATPEIAEGLYSGTLGGWACEDGPYLGVPDTTSEGAPIFLDPERCRPPAFRSQVKPDGFAADWWRARRFFLVRRPIAGEGLVIPVLAGVALEPIPADLGVPGILVFCSVEAEGLATDLCQFSLRQDEALDRLLAQLRAQAPQVMEAMLERLASWKPGFTYTHTLGNMMGFFGGAAGGVALGAAVGVWGPWHFLAIPGALVGSYVAGHLWARKTRKQLKAYLESTRVPPTTT